MPLHAKVLAGLLTLNVLVSIPPLLETVQTGALVGLGLQVLMLLGFLKGSEGVRTLLLIGAGITALFGGVALLAAIPLMASAGALGLLAVLNGGLSLSIGVYMLWALRNPDVTEWMLNRSLGGALDDE